MIEYTAYDSLDIQQLVDIINTSIEEGWKPLGGVSVTGEFHGTLVYVQALTREKKDGQCNN